MWIKIKASKVKDRKLEHRGKLVFDGFFKILIKKTWML